MDNDILYYKFDWGDGSMSEWIGPLESGEEASAVHSWDKVGFYQIKVKARDEHRAESEWSEPKILRIKLSRSDGITDFINWLYQFIQNLLK